MHELMGLGREYGGIDHAADGGHQTAPDHRDSGRRRDLGPPGTNRVEQEAERPDHGQQCDALHHSADHVEREALLERDQLNGQLRDLRLWARELEGGGDQQQDPGDARHHGLPRAHARLVEKMTLGAHPADNASRGRYWRPRATR